MEDHKKTRLYADLFNSLEKNLGIKMEAEIPLEEELENYFESNSLLGLVVRYSHGRHGGEPPESFFLDAPPGLREWLQENFEAFYQKQRCGETEV